MGYPGSDPPCCRVSDARLPPCAVQDPEFGGKCRPKLPRLPEERLDPSQPNPGFNGFGGLTPMNPVDDF